MLYKRAGAGGCTTVESAVYGRSCSGTHDTIHTARIGLQPPWRQEWADVAVLTPARIQRRAARTPSRATRLKSSPVAHCLPGGVGGVVPSSGTDCQLNGPSFRAAWTLMARRRSRRRLRMPPGPVAVATNSARVATLAPVAVPAVPSRPIPTLPNPIPALRLAGRWVCLGRQGRHSTAWLSRPFKAPWPPPLVGAGTALAAQEGMAVAASVAVWAAALAAAALAAAALAAAALTGASALEGPIEVQVGAARAAGAARVSSPLRLRLRARSPLGRVCSSAFPVEAVCSSTS
jgi:hypothetical protein